MSTFTVSLENLSYPAAPRLETHWSATVQFGNHASVCHYIYSQRIYNLLSILIFSISIMKTENTLTKTSIWKDQVWL